jgi:hypothetical protein
MTPVRETTQAATPAYRPQPSERLRDTLAGFLRTAGTGGPVDEGALRGAVVAYARELKAVGLPPERVIVTIKGMANQGGIPDSRHDDVGMVTGRAGLMRTLVQWTIEAYYRPG